MQKVYLCVFFSIWAAVLGSCKSDRMAYLGYKEGPPRVKLAYTFESLQHCIMGSDRTASRTSDEIVLRRSSRFLLPATATTRSTFGSFSRESMAPAMTDGGSTSVVPVNTVPSHTAAESMLLDTAASSQIRVGNRGKKRGIIQEGSKSWSKSERRRRRKARARVQEQLHLGKEISSGKWEWDDNPTAHHVVVSYVPGDSAKTGSFRIEWAEGGCTKPLVIPIPSDEEISKVQSLEDHVHSAVLGASEDFWGSRALAFRSQIRPEIVRLCLEVHEDVKAPSYSPEL